MITNWTPAETVRAEIAAGSEVRAALWVGPWRPHREVSGWFQRYYSDDISDETNIAARVYADRWIVWPHGSHIAASRGIAKIHGANWADADAAIRALGIEIRDTPDTDPVDVRAAGCSDDAPPKGGAS